MSAEERAEKLRIVVDDAWTRVGPIWGKDEAEQKIIDAIAQAIREAEASARNEALEEAAVRCDAEAKNAVGSHCDGLHEAASICRNLKTKD